MTVLTLLVSSAALMVTANHVASDFNALAEPVRMSSELPGAIGYSVYRLDDGNLVLNSSNESGTYLTKLNTRNQIVWTQLIHAGQEPLMRLATLRDGGFLLGGIVSNLYVLVRTNSEGEVEWTGSFDSGAPVNYLMDIAEAGDGGYVMAGFGEPEIDGLGWLWFSKIGVDGDLLWSRSINGPANDCPSHIITNSDGGYVLSDTAYSFTPDQAFFRLIHLDADGIVLRNSSYGGYDYYYQPECNSAIETGDGGHLLLGYLWVKSAWVVKTDKEGVMLWNQTYGKSRDAITAALETPHGYLLQEYIDGNGSGLILTDKLGNMVWNTTWTDVSMPVGMEANFHSLIEAQGGYIMVASKDNAVWLVELNHPQERQMAWLWGVAGALAAAAVAVLFGTLSLNGKGRGRLGFCRFPGEADDSAGKRNQKEP
jgi:hypothetical protein